MKRSSGILIHLTSLPNEHGIGDLGKCAYDWVDFLASAKQEYWQMLPLGPTGFGNSPYSASSAHAANSLLISLDELVQDGLLSRADMLPYDGVPQRVEFDKVRPYKQTHLLKAFENFKLRTELTEQFSQFCAENTWLDAYARFACERENEKDPEFIKFQQFIFQKQWRKFKTYANANGIKLIGDLPMYVAQDSVERQTSPELFDLQSGFVAGTPPSPAYPAGQKWGNPLFRWDKQRENGYRWWIDRLKALLQQADVVRLDYFCGFSRTWATNGKSGHWRPGPGSDLFEKTRRALGQVPFIAEDLGELTREIHTLRDRFGMASTKVLQYAFDGLPHNPYLPSHYSNPNCVVYTGTHDNDTAKGWFASAPSYVRENARHLLRSDGRDISWDLIKFAAYSKADLMMVPFQDVLCLGSEARFNTPGTCSNINWSWRLKPDQINTKTAEALSWMTISSNRYTASPAKAVEPAGAPAALSS